MNENQIRKKIIALCLQMNATGLNQGTSGNISARFKEFMLITPSGIPYEELKPADIAKMTVDDDDFSWTGPSKPSSEWHFHRAILKAKPDIHAIVHTHSTFASVVSIARDDIPACHYMIAAFGGNTVRCAHYETFGTAELSASILTAMEDRSACLLANHGMVAGGKNLDNAMWAAVELETLSRQYYYAKLAGSMTVLPDDEMATVLEKFKTYGQVQKEYGAKGAGKAKAGSGKTALKAHSVISGKSAKKSASRKKTAAEKSRSEQTAGRKKSAKKQSRRA
jgi:L-fuculose-phosphate aldolase